jgi:hypothetical protein
MENRKAVPEAVYEELKMIQALREPCVLQFHGSNGGLVTVQTTLQDVFEDEDGQFLLAENGLTLQLHQLVALNGKPLAYLT